MIVYTNLMQKIFSDPNSSFSDAIADKIDEARSYGTSMYSDSEFDLVFADVDGDVVIEDKKSGEVTTAEQDPETGETKLKCDQRQQSATEPDVVAPRAKGEDGNGNLAPGSTEPDVDSPDDVGITDKDKAGKDKHYSEYDDFEYMDENDAVFTFSDQELADVVDTCMPELDALATQVIAYSDVEDAINLAEQVDQVRNYSAMAEQVGDHDVDALYDQLNYYSDVASDVIGDYEMNMSVTDFFSNLNDDEVDAFFSNLDEIAANAVYSALDYESETGDIATFSDINDILMENYELDQDVLTAFSDMSEDELTDFFSDIDQDSAIVISNALNSEDSVTFSDVNEELHMLDMPLNVVFSDFTEDELADFVAQYSDDGIQLALDIFSEAADDDTITYSDFLTEMDDYETQQLMFSDDDVDALVNNTNELNRAAEVVDNNPREVELAKKVKVLADATYSDALDAANAGHDVDEILDACAIFSEVACDCLEKNGAPIPPENTPVENVVEEKDLDEEVKKTAAGEQPTEKTYSISSVLGNTATGFNPKSVKIDDATDEIVDDGVKIFSTSGVEIKETSNPCLISKMN